MTYDCIVIGLGGVGSAVCYHLARRGQRVLGLDQFEIAHDRGSSHGRTRIIRQAYFEHPDYVPLLRRAYELWAELENVSGTALYRETGLLQVGPPDGVVVPGVLQSAQQHKLPIESLTAAEIRRHFPGFVVNDEWHAALERRAGYLRVEASVNAHAQAAMAAGATLITDQAVREWRADFNSVSVLTTQRRYFARSLVVAAGPWAARLLPRLGMRLEVRRKPQFWFANHDPRYQAEQGCPAFLFETPEGIYYGFPDAENWGVKAACHSGGEPVVDPGQVDRTRRPADEQQITTFLQRHLPGVSPQVTHHEVCLYTMSPDEHFVVDQHPDYPHVCLAAGLSGHGFKFTAVLGEILADLACHGRTKLPAEFLRLRGRSQT